jgi:hypothetical protein
MRGTVMWQKIFKHFLCVASLSLTISSPATAAQNAVEMALTNMGTASIAEMGKRVSSLPFTVRDAAYRREALAQLPPHIRQNRITEGKLLRRVENLIRPVLELHRRSDKIQLYLYQDKIPQGMLFRECVLVLSDSLAGTLKDDELIGIVGHELAHAYLMDEMAAARKRQDGRAMRAVELECDAVAMITLRVMGKDPGQLLKGLQRITVVSKSYQSSSYWMHPQIAEREEFAQRFIQLLSRNPGE